MFGISKTHANKLFFTAIFPLKLLEKFQFVFFLMSYAFVVLFYLFIFLKLCNIQSTFVKTNSSPYSTKERLNATLN